MSSSLRQLPPVSRYYIRRLLQQTLDVLNLRPIGQEGESLSTLGTTTEEVDSSIEVLLNRDGQGAVKLVELERLALLHQGLSTQGTTFRAQMISLEQQVAELLGLEPAPAPTATSELVDPNPAPAQPVTPEPVLPVGSSADIATPAIPQTLTCATYLAMLNEISKFSKKYIGAPITVNTWKAARPQNEWLETIAISDLGEFPPPANDFRLSLDQQMLLREWSVEFIRRSSKVLRNFEQMLKSAGVNMPD